MKKLFLLVVPAMLLFSCNNNDDDAKKSLVATWKLSSITTSEPIDINNDGTATTNFIAETNCYNNSKIILSDGNIANALLEDTDILLDILNGNGTQLGYSASCLSAEDTFGTWSQDNNTVTIILDNSPEIFTLSENTLSISLSEFKTIEVYENGEYVLKSFGANLVFTRQ